MNKTWSFVKIFFTLGGSRLCSGRHTPLWFLLGAAVFGLAELEALLWRGRAENNMLVVKSAKERTRI
jgi:hypothetical protein